MSNKVTPVIVSPLERMKLFYDYVTNVPHRVFYTELYPAMSIDSVTNYKLGHVYLPTEESAIF